MILMIPEKSKFWKALRWDKASGNNLSTRTKTSKGSEKKAKTREGKEKQASWTYEGQFDIED
jgi:hypothetical protein